MNEENVTAEGATVIGNLRVKLDVHTTESDCAELVKAAISAAPADGYDLTRPVGGGWGHIDMELIRMDQALSNTLSAGLAARPIEEHRDFALSAAKAVVYAFAQMHLRIKPTEKDSIG